MKVRVTFRSEIYLEGATLEDCKAQFENVQIFNESLQETNGLDFVETVSIEEVEEDTTNEQISAITTLMQDIGITQLTQKAGCYLGILWDGVDVVVRKLTRKNTITFIELKKLSAEDIALIYNDLQEDFDL